MTGPTLPLFAGASRGAQVVAITAAWAAWSILVGYAAHRLPTRRLRPEAWPWRTTRWERRGRVYRLLGVRRWKDRLPEAGACFEGGVSKRHLGGSDATHLQRFGTETVRAELTHWVVTALGPAMFLLFEPVVAALNCVFAVVANGPCIVVQRYNRARIGRILAHRR
jgi:glycosyl-4,4'-diaponeurosporenoate acyltransferase